ncbi:MAG: hypothetical protein K2I88_03130 [Anaeroplasmataceae bacterium]|nr:hypothetical protein [Anaeroplasmataceae bacterium]
MTLEEKLDVSSIISAKEIPLKKMGILTSKQRRRSLIIFFLMLAYTVYTKFILKTNFFDFITIFIILNMLTLLGLKIMKKSTIALNHNQLYKFLVFLNKLCKVAIFAFSIYEYYQHFSVYIPEHYSISSKEDLPDVLLDLLKTDFKFISFIISILLFIPTLIYFLVFSIKYYFLTIVFVYVIGILFIPVINIIIIFKLVFEKKNTFKYYHMNEDGTAVVVETREIHSYTHRITTILLRLLAAIPVLFFIGFYYYCIYNQIMNP